MMYRREELLEVINQVEVVFLRSNSDGSRINRILAVPDPLYVHNRSLLRSRLRRDKTPERKLRLRRNEVAAQRIADHRQLAAENQRSKHQTRQPYAGRGAGCCNQRRRSAHKGRDRKGFTEGSGLLLKQARSLVSLPVSFGCAVVDEAEPV